MVRPKVNYDPQMPQRRVVASPLDTFYQPQPAVPAAAVDNTWLQAARAMKDLSPALNKFLSTVEEQRQGRVASEAEKSFQAFTKASEEQLKKQHKAEERKVVRRHRDFYKDSDEVVSFEWNQTSPLTAAFDFDNAKSEFIQQRLALGKQYATLMSNDERTAWFEENSKLFPGVDLQDSHRPDFQMQFQAQLGTAWIKNFEGFKDKDGKLTTAEAAMASRIDEIAQAPNKEEWFRQFEEPLIEGLGPQGQAFRLAATKALAQARNIYSSRAISLKGTLDANESKRLRIGASADAISGAGAVAFNSLSRTEIPLNATPEQRRKIELQNQQADARTQEIRGLWFQQWIPGSTGGVANKTLALEGLKLSLYEMQDTQPGLSDENIELLLDTVRGWPNSEDSPQGKTIGQVYQREFQILEDDLDKRRARKKINEDSGRQGKALQDAYNAYTQYRVKKEEQKAYMPEMPRPTSTETKDAELIQDYWGDSFGVDSSTRTEEQIEDDMRSDPELMSVIKQAVFKEMGASVGSTMIDQIVSNLSANVHQEEKRRGTQQTEEQRSAYEQRLNHLKKGSISMDITAIQEFAREHNLTSTQRDSLMNAMSESTAAKNGGYDWGAVKEDIGTSYQATVLPEALKPDVKRKADKWFSAWKAGEARLFSQLTDEEKRKYAANAPEKFRKAYSAWEKEQRQDGVPLLNSMAKKAWRLTTEGKEITSNVKLQVQDLIPFTKMNEDDVEIRLEGRALLDARHQQRTYEDEVYAGIEKNLTTLSQLKNEEGNPLWEGLPARDRFTNMMEAARTGEIIGDTLGKDQVGRIIPLDVIERRAFDTATKAVTVEQKKQISLAESVVPRGYPENLDDPNWLAKAQPSYAAELRSNPGAKGWQRSEQAKIFAQKMSLVWVPDPREFEVGGPIVTSSSPTNRLPAKTDSKAGSFRERQIKEVRKTAREFMPPPVLAEIYFLSGVVNNISGGSKEGVFSGDSIHEQSVNLNKLDRGIAQKQLVQATKMSGLTFKETERGTSRFGVSLEGRGGLFGQRIPVTDMMIGPKSIKDFEKLCAEYKEATNPEETTIGRFFSKYGITNTETSVPMRGTKNYHTERELWFDSQFRRRDALASVVGGEEGLKQLDIPVYKYPRMSIGQAPGVDIGKASYPRRLYRSLLGLSPKDREKYQAIRMSPDNWNSDLHNSQMQKLNITEREFLEGGK